MMGLLSTIRGKRDISVISTDVGPIANKTKKLVVQEWPRLLERQPNLFKIVWNASASRSTSTKKSFDIADNESPKDSESFMNLSTTIQAFFHRIVDFVPSSLKKLYSSNQCPLADFGVNLTLVIAIIVVTSLTLWRVIFCASDIITMQLDDDMVRSTCEQLGARHVDFIARGFNSTFWEIFLGCMTEAIDDTFSSYFTDCAKRTEMTIAWQRCVIDLSIVRHLLN